MATLEQRLKQQAQELGFELAGIATATEADTFAEYQDWLAKDFGGEMGYLHRHAEARRHPESVLPEVRSVIMLGMSYKPSEADDSLLSPNHGRIARYARGLDYHDVIRRKLNDLLKWLQEQEPACIGRGVVDTAPLLERDFARRAGLGWFGKNTMLIHKQRGSYLFLAALLVNLELSPDTPFTANHCGTCTACLDACPTNAFPEPGVMDARKCISYLTIELRGPIAETYRQEMGDWLFGCDICQEVCPWNNRAPAGMDDRIQAHPEWQSVDLLELLTLSDAEFRKRYRGTAIFRTKRSGLLRNAAIILGNVGDESALPLLRKVAHEDDELIREAARWAIQQIELRFS